MRWVENSNLGDSKKRKARKGRKMKKIFEEISGFNFSQYSIFSFSDSYRSPINQKRGGSYKRLTWVNVRPFDLLFFRSKPCVLLFDLPSSKSTRKKPLVRYLFYWPITYVHQRNLQVQTEQRMYCLSVPRTFVRMKKGEKLLCIFPSLLTGKKQLQSMRCREFFILPAFAAFFESRPKEHTRPINHKGNQDGG